jgi:hypothetical protein
MACCNVCGPACPVRFFVFDPQMHPPVLPSAAHAERAAVPALTYRRQGKALPATAPGS